MTGGEGHEDAAGRATTRVTALRESNRIGPAIPVDIAHRAELTGQTHPAGPLDRGTEGMTRRQGHEHAAGRATSRVTALGESNRIGPAIPVDIAHRAHLTGPPHPAGPLDRGTEGMTRRQGHEHAAGRATSRVTGRGSSNHSGPAIAVDIAHSAELTGEARPSGPLDRGTEGMTRRQGHEHAAGRATSR